MNAAIAVFVKTPALSPVKTRLAKTIGKKRALEFYHLSVQAIQDIVQQTNIDAFWAVGEEQGVYDPLWSEFETMHTGEGNLGERQHHVYNFLLKKYDRVLLIGADAPQISLELLAQALIDLDRRDFVIGPAHDGGYYLFAGRVFLDKDIWASVPWSTEKAREKLEERLPSKPLYLPFLTDVDTKDDLQSAAQEMPHPSTKSQKKIINWIASLRDAA